MYLFSSTFTNISSSENKKPMKATESNVIENTFHPRVILMNKSLFLNHELFLNSVYNCGDKK